MDIPDRIDEVTASWLDTALHGAGVITSSQVTDIDLAYLGEGVGLLGELASCRVHYSHSEPGAPSRLIVKIPSAHQANRERGYAFGFYQREARFYEEIGNPGRTGGLRVPRCWAALSDPDSGRFALVLEDMTEWFRMSDQVAGISADEATVAVSQLARFHAYWWDTAELDALDWMPPSNGPTTMQAAPLYRHLWPTFAEKFGHLLPPGGAEIGGAVGERFEWLLDEIGAEGHRTITHTDFRHDNLFFAPPGNVTSPVAVIDWQLSTRGRGVYDVAYLLMQSMDPDDRRQSEAAILRTWHQAVTAAGVAGYSLDDAKRDYRISALVGLVIPVAAGGDMDLGNERGVAVVEHLTARAFQAVVDLVALTVMS